MYSARTHPPQLVRCPKTVVSIPEGVQWRLCLRSWSFVVKSGMCAEELDHLAVMEINKRNVGRCNREKPPCKYFHPPQHLKDQLLINGRNHLALKNALMTQIQGLNPGTPVVPGTIPMSSWTAPNAEPDDRGGLFARQFGVLQPNSPYLGIPAVGNFNPYIGTSVVPMGMTEAVPSPMTGSIVPQTVVTAQKVPRTDRLEVCREFQRGACKRAEPECRFAHPPDHVSTTDEGTVTVCMDATKSRCSRDPCRYFHPPPHLQAQLRASQGRAAQQPVPGAAVAAAAASVPAVPPPPLPAAAAAAAAAAELGKKRGRDPHDELLMAFPGMGVPYKRTAGDKSGVPVYQPTGNAAYQQALMQQIGGQSFVPVSCEYRGGSGGAGSGGPLGGAGTQGVDTDANKHAAAAAAVVASSTQPATAVTAGATAATSTTSTALAILSSSKASSNTTNTTSLSSSSASNSSSGSSELANASPAPLGLQPGPMNVLSYTGFALSKGMRPAMKPAAATNLPPPSLVAPGPTMSTAAAMPGFNFSSSAMPNMGLTQYMMPPVSMSMPIAHMGMGFPNVGGISSGLALPGVGAGNVSLVNPSLIYPQYPSSSLVMPQYTALAGNTQYTLAQGGEQPYKKLKTS
ncbi:uncharacterized protein LOC143021335 isoform X3 [Oratosquilla oratoria]|uniref:uncharacterized protein LOC143021335 isoform X3 n=1 Tax=Oratosquilla oratoria TaxID=337810 RepID=UPI003F76E036